MKVKEIMTTIPIKISVDSTISDAAKIMAMKNIGSLFIEENGKMIGIITEGDILKKVVAKGKDPKNIAVRDIMSGPLIIIDPEKSIEDANELMTKNKIRRLPVESNGDIVGMVTIRDISNNLRYSLGKSIIGDSGTKYYRPSYGKPEE